MTHASRLAVLLGVIVLVVAPMAYAHVGAGETAGFLRGFAHPLGGLDHLLAMVAVGLWAGQRGGRARWTIPMAFVTIMILGGIMGALGVTLPYVEQGIALSVLVLGILVAAAVSWPLPASMLLVGVFALFHGHAHGAEMPISVFGTEYGAGFVLATAILHASGVGAAILSRDLHRSMLVRLSGTAIAASGLVLLLAA
jgi:urease accessory protein